MKHWRVLHRSKDLIGFDDQIIQPISVLLSAWTDNQVDYLICKPFELSADDCQIQKWINQFLQGEKSGLVRNGGSSVFCTRDECKRDFYIYDNPAYTADVILDFIAK